MVSSIDETELARLEALAGKADLLPINEDELFCLCIDGLDEHRHSYIVAACNAVPALVAEVRRLNDIILNDIDIDVQNKVSIVHLTHENAALREKVEAWEWWEEVRTYDPWSEHPYCTACGNRSKRGKIFDCAIDEYEKIKSTAREAVHADRE